MSAIQKQLWDFKVTLDGLIKEIKNISAGTNLPIPISQLEALLPRIDILEKFTGVAGLGEGETAGLTSLIDTKLLTNNEILKQEILGTVQTLITNAISNLPIVGDVVDNLPIVGGGGDSPLPDVGDVVDNLPVVGEPLGDIVDNLPIVGGGGGDGDANILPVDDLPVVGGDSPLSDVVDNLPVVGEPLGDVVDNLPVVGGDGGDGGLLPDVGDVVDDLPVVGEPLGDVVDSLPVVGGDGLGLGILSNDKPAPVDISTISP